MKVEVVPAATPLPLGEISGIVQEKANANGTHKFYLVLPLEEK